MARPRRTDIPYFSPRLKARLHEALNMRSVFIEAPSGYGKTTIAQNYLRERLPAGATWVRHVCVEESPQAAWRRFCQTMQKVDAHTGKTMLSFGLPDEDSAGHLASLLRELPCPTPFWLVLDDFHHLAPHVPAPIWKAFLEHDAAQLRLIVVTRPVATRILPYEKAGILRLNADDLRLTETESREYATRAGIALNEAQAHELHRRAEGWIIAATLYLRRWNERGAFAPAYSQAHDTGLDDLLRDVVWDNLDEAGQECLLRLSPFDAFSAEQAAFLLGKARLPQKKWGALQHNAMLRHDPASGLYYPHSTLLDFTRRRFAELPEATRRDALLAAGDWCARSGDLENAFVFYYRLGDYERILALDLSGMKGEGLLDMPGVSYVPAIRDIAANSTRAMKAMYPLSAIALALDLLSANCPEEFGALFAELADIVETEPFATDQRNYLRGELRLLEAFTCYNDIAAMGVCMQDALQLAGRQTSMVRLDDSWTFGNVSVLFMFHREAGRLDGELADMQTYCPHYLALSGGHGAGGPELMEAECRLHRGDADTAEISGYTARHQAALREQASIGIGAEFLLGRVALLRGNAAALTDAMDNMAGIAGQFPQRANRMAADMARSFLMSLLHQPDEMAPWLREATPGSLARRFFVQVLPFAELCRARYLLLSGKPELLLGESEAALGLASALNYSLALTYGHLHVAAAWSMLGKRDAAADSLRAALALALPDGLLLPFAECWPWIGPLLERMRPDMYPDTLPAFASGVFSLAGRLEAGRRAVADTRHSARGRFGLSPREDEVARLMADGLSYGEIAQRLCISLNTVKTHLKNAYQKVGTSSRSDMKRLLS
ncbi:LuxR C-terminal-related transcriptional regulator [Nitratidesulfovibrio sp.]|uniref:LuxR C-terminal-related transcriptional regulator n=1 Tax=Nitratidesulfovibrio sp. TaxID=2802297 RepID=UPI003342DF3E